MDRATYVAPVWRMGKSVVVPLYKLLTRALGILPGDLLLMRVHPPYVTFRLLNVKEQMPVESFTVEDLPRELVGGSNGR